MVSFRGMIMLGALAIANSGTAGAASYTYTQINVPGATSTPAATGINDSGATVGYYTASAFQGFVDAGGRFTTISVPGSSGTQPLGINNAGQAVGTFFTNIGGRNAFVYSNGATTVLNVLGSGFAEATGINNVGQIAGYFGAGSGFSGFLDSNGTFTTLRVPGSAGTEAFGINDAGQIVGIYLDTLGGSHPFLYSSGTFTPINVPSDPFAYSTGINNQGQIVGYFSTGSGTSSFLDDNGTFTTLRVPGSAGTEAFGVNDAGQVAGLYFDAFGGQHAFVATPTPEPTSMLLIFAAAPVFLLFRMRRKIGRVL